MVTSVYPFWGSMKVLGLGVLMFVDPFGVLSRL